MDDDIIDIDDDQTEQQAIVPDTFIPESAPTTITAAETTTTTPPPSHPIASDYENSAATPWTADHDPDMDEESRALIEQMLAEEQYYYGTDTISTLPNTLKTTKSKTTTNKRKASTTNASKKLKTEPSISSASLPSHKTRWTPAEDNILRTAIELHGYGNWKAIATQVKTRNSLQCKNRARHWVLSDKLEKQSVSPTSSSTNAPSSPSQQQHVTIKEEAQDEEDDEEDETSKAMVQPTKTEEYQYDDEDDEEISVEDSDTPPLLSMELPILSPDKDNEEEEDMHEQRKEHQETLDQDMDDGEDDEVGDDDNNSNYNDDKTQQQMIPMEQAYDVFSADHTIQETVATTTNDEPDNLKLAKAEEDNVTQKPEDPAIQGPPPDPQVHASSPLSSSTSDAAVPSSPVTVAPATTETVVKPEMETAGAETEATIPQTDTSTLFDKHTISEEEQQSNPEWFSNKHSKTPDRYLKIRNHILQCWRECQPRYLTKTSARKGLSNCGDVNAIGRVHAYLENVGAINVGCVNNAPRQPPKRTPREAPAPGTAAAAGAAHDETLNDDMFAAADLVIGYDGPRKRKVRNELGEWVDPKELEGRVIEHGKKEITPPSRPKRVIKRPHHHFDGSGYDPFRLVPLEYYDDEYPAPFIVDITSDALLIMDFHSHLAHTEIIGLLGGNFVDNEQGGNSSGGGNQKVLKVQSVFPCKSTSTGIQCEMDPASEMKAREVFAEKGYSVVGWYHSHPTFEPHPSIRDIENQTSYQTLFRHENTGDEPFIGVIVTPYDTETVSDHSIIQYIHISPRWNESAPFRVPYACKRMVYQSGQVSPQVFQEFLKLVGEFKDYEHKVNMLHPFTGSRTRLDKLLDSIRANLFLPADQVTEYLERVRQLMLSQFVTDTIKSSSLSPINDDGHSNDNNILNDHETSTTTAAVIAEAANPSPLLSSSLPLPETNNNSAASSNSSNSSSSSNSNETHTPA
ncbi:hypothetical protein BDB00DRAFT_851327 [Zychaea mexicana]|uniref:uncharacterized protein n=1 Tax=Zychaea mexicana TaxID=64656 RepID=UPI0022FEB259|nr:uncharacterized protein BDB00DRAFT_851327 [Zychaea mexicana]KAI9485156.1 hypothetical protein BDB00DRAFT_851327 [Zychaea mexicana]